jgi:hypothetical protein
MNRCSVWKDLIIEPGTFGDYAAMNAFHYRGGHPGAVKRVFVARHGNLRAGVIVESLPPLGCALRSLALPGRFACDDRSLAAARLNREMRTISRVVVQPVFRSVGLAVALVRHLLERAQTPFVESLAAMGRMHPFFERAGMRRYDRPALPEAVRLTAALEQEGFSPVDLVSLAAEQLSPFLEKELLRFARRADSPAAALEEARTRLLSQPLYFLWSKREKDHAELERAVDRAGQADRASEKRQRDAGGRDGEAAPAHRPDGPL